MGNAIGSLITSLTLTRNNSICNFLHGLLSRNISDLQSLITNNNYKRLLTKFRKLCPLERENLKNVVSKFLVITLIVLFVFSISALGFTRATSSGSFTFKAWIDGTDYLYVQGGGGTVWYYHVWSNFPGWEINNQGEQYAKENHVGLPTYVDGNSWYPTWDNFTGSSWIDVQSLSDKYTNPAPHPTGP